MLHEINNVDFYSSIFNRRLYVTLYFPIYLDLSMNTKNTYVWKIFKTRAQCSLTIINAISTYEEGLVWPIKKKKKLENEWHNQMSSNLHEIKVGTPKTITEPKTITICMSSVHLLLPHVCVWYIATVSVSAIVLIIPTLESGLWPQLALLII